MIIPRNQIIFFKANKEILKDIFQRRKEDFVRALVNEKDPILTEAYKIIVREWDNWLLINENLTKLKKSGKKEKPFTGL